jgi:transcription termination factor Rho
MTLGIFDPAPRGGGFLRRRAAGWQPDRTDVRVGDRVVRQFGLRPGDEVDGTTRNGQRGQPAELDQVTAINGRPPADALRRPDFARLGAVHPRERLRIDHPGARDLTGRVVDLFAPLGRGQRALVVAPAKAGKTTVLQALGSGLAANHPGMTVMVLLVDERPEEVFEMEQAGIGEVVASSFDQDARAHMAVAELTLERARRRVEYGEDVVLIVDSLTRLARAANTARQGTGRTLSGGLDADAMERPKRFFGSARAVDPRHGGGSLTIIATALVDTGSRLDQVIFEEFKGTGNSELVLSRELAERRIFPAIDLPASATRREEQLLDPRELAVAHELRRRAADAAPGAAMQMVLGELKRDRDLAATVARLGDLA